MKKIIYVIVVLIIIFAGAAIIGYFRGNDLMSSISFGLIKSQAFEIGGEGASIAELNDNTQSNIKFYESSNKIDFSGTDGEKMKKIVEKEVLDSMINSEITKKLAGQYGISASDAEIQADLDKVISQVGDRAALEKNLSDAFGWTIEDFKNNVVKKQILEQRLSEYISSNSSLNKDALDKITNILKKAKSGQDFAELAKEYSDCPSSEQGGSLGNFAQLSDDKEGKYPHMVAEFEEAAFALEPGQISDIVKTQFGYHIIKLEEKTADAGGIELANARHILVKTTDYAAWFSEQKKSIDVKIYLKDYVWKNGALEFADDSMNQFEQDKASSLSS